MRIIRVEDDLSIEGVEGLLSELGRDPQCELMVATKPKKRGLGGDVALIQFLTTWSSLIDKPSLRTYLANGADPSVHIQEILKRDHCLIAMLRASLIRTVDGSHDITSEARSAAEKVVRDSVTPSDTRRGAKAFILCTSRRELHPILYYDSPSGGYPLRAHEDFKERIGALLQETVGSQSKSAATFVVENYVSRLAGILRELVENTHLWATTDSRGYPSRDSVRGLRIEFFNQSHSKLMDFASSTIPLARYLSAPRFNRDAYHKFLEISVFDSGPGYAARWLKRSLGPEETIGDEYTVVRQCLALHGSSAPATHRGVGLHEVMKLVGESGGFLRLRTGRLHLYRDFMRDHFKAADSSISEPFLRDWDDSAQPKTRAAVQGTVITLIIPIELESRRPL